MVGGSRRVKETGGWGKPEGEGCRRVEEAEGGGGSRRMRGN
jgi:hypothetical protein